MQEYQQISSIYTERKIPNRNRIGLLGGTFNPVHNGHIIMAQIALCEFLLGEVVFLPSGQPPHKLDEKIAPAWQRAEMIKLAIEGYERFTLSTIEIDRKGTTYTIDTLEQLRSKDPQSDYYFIIGADTLFELPTWRNISRVMQMADFICVMRPGIDEKMAHDYAKMICSKSPCTIYMADEKGPNISSTNVRMMAVNNELSSSLVPPAVLKYIKQNDVYTNEE